MPLTIAVNQCIAGRVQRIGLLDYVPPIVRDLRLMKRPAGKLSVRGPSQEKIDLAIELLLAILASTDYEPIGFSAEELADLFVSDVLARVELVGTETTPNLILMEPYGSN